MMFSRAEARARSHDLWEKVPSLHSFRMYLYALCSPDGEMVYIGKSNHVIQRLKAHITNPRNEQMAQWIEEIGSENVCIKVLGVFEGMDVSTAENRLIKHLTAKGVRLFNSMGVLSKAEQAARYRDRTAKEREDRRLAAMQQAEFDRQWELRQIGAAGLCILINRLLSERRASVSTI